MSARRLFRPASSKPPKRAVRLVSKKKASTTAAKTAKAPRSTSKRVSDRPPQPAPRPRAPLPAQTSHASAPLRTPTPSSGVYADQAAIDLLNALPADLQIGYDVFVRSHCRSVGLDGFGIAVAHNVAAMKQEADLQGVPFTALILVNALMQTVMLMMQQPSKYARKDVITAMRLCPYLLLDLLDDPYTITQASDFLIQQNTPLLLSMQKGP